MSKRFQRGLVVGKFSPLHRGHEFLIQRAIDACEEIVIISYSNPEYAGCEASHRQLWLSKLFPSARILVATNKFRELPANDADETIHRRFCGYLCAEVIGVTVDAVFTSEGYGYDFAQELTHYFRNRTNDVNLVHHVLVDSKRTQFPISGTMLREDIHANRRWLSPEVYSSFVKRVCLLGGESSGKSTLTVSLAQEFNTAYVHEYGRELWESRNGQLEFADMLGIGLRQIEMEDEAAGRADRFLFCDTSPLTTLFYSHHLFGRSDTRLQELANRTYDTVVLCAPDFSFFQDGTRQTESFRELQHQWYLKELNERCIPFVLVSGTVADRICKVKGVLRAKA